MYCYPSYSLPNRYPCRDNLFLRLCLWPSVSWKDALMREAVRGTKRSARKHIRGDYVREAREEKEKMGERATQAASKSAKDGGISTEEAADLVEESRDSALAEGQKKVNNRQIIVFLIIIIFIIWMTTVDPNSDPRLVDFGLGP